MTDEHSFHLDKQTLRRSFERAAEDYDAAAVLQREIGRRMFERLDLMRIAPACILDVGAGTGTASAALAKRYRGARVIALDIAHAMLRQARRRIPWFSRMRCVCGDMERLPVADRSVDMIFSNLALQWSNDPEVVFAEFRRVLKPGGMLLFSTFGPDTLKELRASWSRADGHTHVSAFIDMHDLGDALVRARLADPVMDMERITMTYPDVFGLMRDLKCIGAHNATAGRPRGLTGKRRLQAMVDAYESFRRDGVLPATYEIVYGHAWAPLQEDASAGVREGVVRIPIQRVGRKLPGTTS